MSRETVPPPSIVKDRCAEILSIVEVLGNDFRWAFFAAYDRSVRDEAKTRSSSRPDPVGELVVDGIDENSEPGDRPNGKTLMRRNLSQAARLTDQAFAKLEKAHRLVAGDPKLPNHPSWKRVHGSLDSLDPRSIDMHSDGRLQEGDAAVYAAAQARRNGRGDGYGES